MNYINELINNYKINAGPVNIKDLSNKIKEEVKLGVKEGISEAAVLEELLEVMREEHDNAKSDLINIKSIALVSSLLFFSYFLFIGSSIDPNELIQYNWFNQSLINIKLSIIEFISLSKPGSSGGGNGSTSRDMVDRALSPINLPVVEGKGRVG